MNQIYGWFTPTGRLIECDALGHIAVISKDEELRSVPKVADTLAELQEKYDSCQESADREGNHNAEWHWYEIACDKARPKLVKYLYRNGYLRVGTFKEAFHFEGFPDVVRSRRQLCEDFAEGYGMTAVFEPTRDPSTYLLR